MSLITVQLMDFLQFILIGIIVSIIFDFFRAYRIVKKNNNFSVFFQDFIYFFIVTLIIILSIVYVLDTELRLYIFIAIILGIGIYISLFSKYFLFCYDKIFKLVFKIFDFILLPIYLVSSVLKIISNFFSKKLKKCCKKFFYVISLICIKLHKKRG